MRSIFNLVLFLLALVITVAIANAQTVQRYVDVLNGVVTNVLMWDGVSAYTVPDGGTLIQNNTNNVGDTYSNGTFTASTQSGATCSPNLITATQLRLALSKLGVRSAVETAVKSQSQAVQDYYNFSPTYSVNNPAILAIATAAGYSTAQVVAMFQTACAFPATY